MQQVSERCWSESTTKEQSSKVKEAASVSWICLFILLLVSIFVIKMCIDQSVWLARKDQNDNNLVSSSHGVCSSVLLI